jgi:hypothetical protein
LRIDYDGAIAADGLTGQPRQRFAVLGGTRQSAELMEKFLQKEHVTDAALPDAINVAFDAWSVGRMATGEDATKELPERDAIRKYRDEQLANAGMEAAVLERDRKSAIRYRTLADEEVRSALQK